MLYSGLLTLSYFYIDPRYFLFVGPALLLALWAQARVRSAFGKYSEVPLGTGYRGAEVASRVLASAGVEGVTIEPHKGWLSDHYDPRSRTLRLSEANYDGRSLAAAAVAAHEAGHAIQHAVRYLPLELRSLYVPAASAGSWLAFPMIFLGAILSFQPLINIGVALFGALVLFQLINLPVEFDASRRARKVLDASGIIVSADEEKGVRSVLGAAALTYVAATLQAVLTLLYYLYVLGFFGRRD